MKKLVSLLLVMLMGLSCLVLVSCGGGSSSGGGEDLSGSRYVGTWKATELSMQGESEAADEGGEFIIELSGDGTGQTISREAGGEEEVGNITWELTDDGFKTSGDMKLKFTDDGDNIKAKVLGADLVFEKQ